MAKEIEELNVEPEIHEDNYLDEEIIDEEDFEKLIPEDKSESVREQSLHTVETPAYKLDDKNEKMKVEASAKI